MTDGLGRQLQWCGHCTGTLWWRELRLNAKLSIYRLIYVPTLAYGHEFWGSDRKSEITDANSGNELSLKGGWPLLRGEVKNSVIREGIRVEVLLLNVERSQLKWFRYLTRMDPGCVLLSYQNDALEQAQDMLEWLSLCSLGSLYLSCCPLHLTQDKL